jgi:hypothetical protein
MSGHVGASDSMLRASATEKRWQKSVPGILSYNLKKILKNLEAGRALNE